MGNAFGYDPEVTYEIKSLEVADGKHYDTLMPIVVMRIGTTEDGPEINFSLTPDEADALADGLKKWAERSRAEHWE